MNSAHFCIQDRAGEFRHLQKQLRDRWRNIDRVDYGDEHVLVVPSLTLDQRELLKVQGTHHYEERFLFSLIRLRNPRSRLIYVTSLPIPPIVVDYYLQLLPGIPFSHARDRLLLFSTYDGSQKPLSQKILERPRLIERMRQALPAEKSYMVCFNATAIERDLSVALGVPLLATDPDLCYWGTKSGSRQIFQECEVPHPDGSPLVKCEQDLAEAAVQVWERQPSLQRIVVKLNEGFSGEGNALLSLVGLSEVAATQRVATVRDRFFTMRFQARGETWENYSSRIPELGAIAEAFIEGDYKKSPSVQGRINPDSEVEILSTHDQILGGTDGQVYLGCRFPADEAYRLHLQEMGLRVGQNLAKKGALESFSVDFVAVRDRDRWSVQAVEINLRRGGTTHPFMTMKLLTNGAYDRTDGLFRSQHGRLKFYVASDNLQKPAYRGLLPTDLMDIIAHHCLHFDSSTETGTVFHLMGSLSEFGKLGLTSIGNSPHQAQEIYNRVVEVLDWETADAMPDVRSIGGSNSHKPLGRSHPTNPIAWY